MSDTLEKETRQGEQCPGCGKWLPQFSEHDCPEWEQGKHPQYYKIIREVMA